MAETEDLVAEIEALEAKLAEAKQAITRRFIGQERVVDLVLAALLCGGHGLLIGLPGLVSGQVGSGLFRIGRGLAKKLLFADVLRVGVVDPIFAEPGRFTSLELLVALYAYTLQIYYDFSGYTDIAIGSELEITSLIRDIRF